MNAHDVGITWLPSIKGWILSPARWVVSATAQVKAPENGVLEKIVAEVDAAGAVRNELPTGYHPGEDE